jgi:hypothetical protein
MRKIINGHRYDTDSAKFIISYAAELTPDDDEYYEEKLYRTKAGMFFLYAKGNSGSPYSKPVGIKWIGTEEILPLSEEEAQNWIDAKTDLDADEYEYLFGKASEKIKISADLSEADKARFDKLKEHKRMSAGELISWLMSNCTE